MLISMADAVAKEERFTKAAELCVQVMKWSGRTALVVFTGLGGLKGMLVPVSETYKKKMHLPCRADHFPVWAVQ